MTKQGSQREWAAPWGGGRAWQRWRLERACQEGERYRPAARMDLIQAASALTHSPLSNLEAPKGRRGVGKTGLGQTLTHYLSVC